MYAIVWNEKMPKLPSKKSTLISKHNYLKRRINRQWKRPESRFGTKCVQVQDEREDECMDCKDLEEQLLKVKSQKYWTNGSKCNPTWWTIPFETKKTNYICWWKVYRVYATVHNGDSFPQCGNQSGRVSDLSSTDISRHRVWYATTTYNNKWNAVRKLHTFTNPNSSNPYWKWT